MSDDQGKTGSETPLTAAAPTEGLTTTGLDASRSAAAGGALNLVPPAPDPSPLPVLQLQASPRKPTRGALLRQLLGLSRDVSDSREETKKKNLDLLRQLRAEIQGLQSLLLRIRNGEATLSTYAGYVEKNRVEIDKLFAHILEVLPDGHVADGDNVRHIHNQWQMLLCSPIIAAPRTQAVPADQVREIAVCDQLCRAIVAHIGHLTIPARLNEWLEDGWNGYLLPFHDLFADELPEAEERNKLLRILAAAPGIIKGGIVEQASGLIFPYHHRWYTRYLVCLGLALGYVFATLTIWHLGKNGSLALLESESWPLVLNWLLVVAGVVTHYAVDRSKGGSAGGTKAIPLGHPSYVMDARAGVVLLKGVLMLLGFFGLLFLDPKEPRGHLDFFLVGYSLDSFVGIVSSSLDQRATARGAELAKATK